MKDLLIGITADFAPAEPGRDARYFLKSSYVSYFRKGGARVVLLPFVPPFNLEDWSFLDGVVLSGSGPDIPPRFYGEPQKFFPGNWMHEDRVNFEFTLLELSERTQIPLFGICGGFQTMNVYRGGSLVQDLPTLSKSPFRHQESEHTVEIRLPWKEGRTGNPDGEDEGPVLLNVNSFHHQGVDRLGSGLEVLAVASGDRLVEGFRDPSHPFFVGVQWHPERMPPEDPLSRTLRAAFLESCRNFSDGKVP
jgi:putative glutamine amidotransferase